MLQVRSQLQELAGRVAADRRGVTAVITALALTTLLGFCGLAVDVVMWQVNQRQLQGAADQAVLAAATAFRNAGETGALGDSTTAQNAAYATAIASGYPVASVTVAAYNDGASCTGDGCLPSSCIASFPANPVPSGTYCPGNINNQSVTCATGAVIIITGGLSTKGNSTLAGSGVTLCDGRRLD